MKTYILLAALVFGTVLPFGHHYTFLIRYLLMIMLFFSFLNIYFDRSIVHMIHFEILAVTIILAVAAYLLLKSYNIILAEAAFVTAIGPTATASPVIINLKNGNVMFVTFSVLLNNVIIAVVIPFLLSLILQSQADIYFVNILIPVLITILIPLAAAQLLKYLIPKLWKKFLGWQDISFYILVLNIYIAVSEASHYIQTELNGKFEIILPFAITSILICLISFSSGRFLGRNKFQLEAGQVLGQKNNAFTIWVALTFLNPIAVLGPVFYVFSQNIYISLQLYKPKSKKM